ncbi:MAG: NAD-dependent epimerase/dehydratase family protein, partial [Comamonadaceae bacterium]
ADEAAGVRADRVEVTQHTGAHPSGLIGEDPRGVPNNLMPYVAQVAAGQRAQLEVFGNDYATPDGTGVRDYIHVQDLARGHVLAVRALLGGADSFTVNLGAGRGHSVLEVVRAFEVASGRPVPCRMAARRPGDVAAYYADPAEALRLLGWRASHTLADMCADAWRWQNGQLHLPADGREEAPEAGASASTPDVVAVPA